jgi:hypothetical protein
LKNDTSSQTNILKTHEPILSHTETRLNEDTEFKSKEKDNYDQELCFKNIISIIPEPIPSLYLLKFLYSPLCKNRTLICKILRSETSKFSERLYPKYSLFIHNNEKLLMVAKKIWKPTSSNYLIMISDGDFDQSSPGYLGKISSNFLCTEFNIFDKGKNPKESNIQDEWRNQYGAINYVRIELNFFKRNSIFSV